jgi:hypothetical protein
VAGIELWGGGGHQGGARASGEIIDGGRVAEGRKSRKHGGGKHGQRRHVYRESVRERQRGKTKRIVKAARYRILALSTRRKRRKHPTDRAIYPERERSAKATPPAHQDTQ